MEIISSVTADESQTVQDAGGMPAKFTKLSSVAAHLLKPGVKPLAF